MKIIIVAKTVLLLSAWMAAGQGTINFNNNIPGQVIAPIYGPETGDPSLAKSGNTVAGLPPGAQTYTGALLSGPGWSAQLLGGPAGTPESGLVSLSPVTTFRTAGAAGFINPVSFAAPFPAGSTLTFQMVAWDNQGGAVATWGAASALWQSGQLAAGKSPLYSGPVSGDTTFLRSFNVSIVPEPSSILLLFTAGVVAFLARRSAPAPACSRGRASVLASPHLK